ncbi:O-antigen ligase family protein [Mucilaginibacter terrae]|uniref:Inorganic carbon (HCO3(-)) transporter n=1 Tax=Mucilaginibacter terrae TaxID=1955052 RepID=A0ABU3GWS3_9SPHI|nr:O-antigen ligase family protein [Mucilaginibacter terrae]MDT3404209.1 putative inorganic carbon (HCO3(-)) transporter [Mucilaginibacter terrae]
MTELQATIPGSKTGSIKQWLVNLFLIQKLKTPVGMALLLAAGGVIAAGTVYMGLPFGILLMLAIGVLPLLHAITSYPKFGITLQLIMAYFLFMLGRIGVPGPIGTLMDGIQFLLLLGLAVRVKNDDNNWGYFKSPITTVLLIWLGYNILEFGNPFAESRMAWMYTIRTVAIVLLGYFVHLYSIRSVQFIRYIFKLWLAMALIAALYAYKQEYIGFSDAEEAYLHSDPAIASLLFIAGHWRKFSTFSDPVSFSYNMVMPTILCVCVIAGKFKPWKKIVLLVCAFLYMSSMLFSGTRGANVLLPAALLLFAILNYSQKVLIFTCVAAVFLLVLINIPTGNPNIQRFQTAFRPNNDDSYNLRKQNQKRIQPYILTHPMGGGLGATGDWGKKFAPGSFLASFPPDSGYIRVAVEEGWLGLGLFCLMMFTIMKKGINNYYQMKDPELKTYCLAMTLVVFAYNIANFPQEALVQYPSNVFFYLEVALIEVTFRLDQAKQKEAEALQVLNPANI